MKILVTGSDGFVAKNLILQLGNFKNLDILKLNKKNYSTLNIKNTYKKESVFLASVICITTSIVYIVHKLS